MFKLSIEKSDDLQEKVDRVKEIAKTCAYVTKSAWPLLAFMLIPKWNYNHSDENQEEKKDE